MLQSIKFILILSLILCAGSKDCDTSSDCEKNYETCPIGGGQCQHKSIFPMYADQFFGTFLVGVGLGLCNAGGIGGGPILIPLLILFNRFRQSQAVPLATFIIFIGALVRFIYNWNQTHPVVQKRVAIDYNIIIVLLPMALFGTTLGVLVNDLSPDAVIMVVQTIVFLLAAVQTFRKGIQLFKKQNKLRKQIKQVSKEDDDKQQVGIVPSKSLKLNQSVDHRNGEDQKQNQDQQQQKQQQEQEHNAKNTIKNKNQPMHVHLLEQQPQQHANDKNNLGNTQIQNKNLERLIKQEGTHCPLKKLLILWFVVFSLIIISLLRGGRGDSIAGIQRCSTVDWILQAIFLLICITVTALVTVLLNRQDKLKQRVGYQYLDTDFIWNVRGVIKLAIFSLIGATIATMVGVGGGIIYNPLLLSLGIPPQVSSATAMYIVLYNNFSASVQYIISSKLDWDFALWLSIFATLGTIVGLFVINGMVKKSGRQSLIVIILACVITLGTILTPTVTGIRLSRQSDIWRFGSVC